MIAGPAVAADGPWSIEGTVPDAGATQIDDIFGNVKEVGPLNSNTTKIGVIHDDAVPTLGETNPNAQVDLRRAWLGVEQDTDDDFWLYFAWERDKNTGSGFIAYEFMKEPAPDACAYDGPDAALIPVCNPWENRSDGDFMILWDQQGGSLDLYLRIWDDSSGTLLLGAPTALNATVSQAAYSANGFFGEAAVNLTDTIFGGANECISFANTIPSTVTGNSDTADYKDTILETTPPISNCGSVTIRKETVPDEDPNTTLFGFERTFEAESDAEPPDLTFDLTDDDSMTWDDVPFGTGYVVDESDIPAGWALDSIDCSASDGYGPGEIVTDVAAGTVTFDLDAGQSLDCTYTNETGGTVIIRKATDPSPDPSQSSFGFSTDLDRLTGPDDPTASLKDGENATWDDVLLGTGYTITEDTLPTGWALESINCDASSGVTPDIDLVNGMVTFDINDADDVLDCTYGNQTGGQVIIRKVTQPSPDGTDTSFDYSTTLATLVAGDSTFSLKDGESKSYDNVLFGTDLTVTEGTLPAGWELVGVNCEASSGVTPEINGAVVTFDIDDAEDLLDCTYTNRAAGSIVVEKITDSGTGSFEFTSSTLAPSPFTLTTTAAGPGGKDSETFSDLDPGTYDVAETVPDYWNLVSATCDDGSDPAAIGLSPGETVTCTFHDDREVGAIEITKLRKHAEDGLGEDHPHAGVDFVITGGELPAEGMTVTTDANGVACATGLLVSGLAGMYTITEAVPAGYAPVGTQTANVTEAADCDSANAGAVKEFVNTPLTNITVSVDSQVDGGTYSSIECDVDGSDSVAIADAEEDPSITINDLEPRTVVCTIVIDP
ncbi:prealbumin-like fold domain-containing protein [Agromyces sp. ZXT2-3]|uniref:prealbumin-like fold domain-containing protein n=1 Tax=Agromyces sp. ZXT2-3 TaxID=3461152 RepID=UPI004054F23F